jgi:hypothetical protein
MKQDMKSTVQQLIGSWVQNEEEEEQQQEQEGSAVACSKIVVD